MSEKTVTDTQAPPATYSSGDRDSVFRAIRVINREGKAWTVEEAEMLTKTYLIPSETIFKWGKQIYDHFVLEHNGYNGTTLKRIEIYLTDNYRFRRNIITRKIMMRTPESKIEEICRYNDIWRALQHKLKDFGSRAKFSLSDVQTLLESNYVKEYNPIKDYFEHLPPWRESDPDFIEQLGQHVKCADQKFWLEQFKKCMVRMIACSYGGQENRIVMTLFTPVQSVGKNRWIKFLVPPMLADYYKEDPVSAHKDSEIALTENFLWHFDELEALNRTELTSLKSFISRSSSKQRRAYARQEETRQRIVNFWGSTNKDEFLTDIENTRWLCFRVESIDWDYSNDETGVRKVDINKVWAQAWYLYKHNFNWRLDTQEKIQQDTINKSFESMGMEKQLIIKYMQPGKAEAMNSDFMLIVEIFQYLQAQTRFKINLNNYAIATAMKQLGYAMQTRLINGKSVRGYWVIKQALLNGEQIPMTAISDEIKPPIADSPLPF